MPVKLTMEEVINRCVNNGLDLPLIGENYINSNTKIKFQCQNDPDHIYERTTSRHWVGGNCPICSDINKQRHSRKTTNEYIIECLEKCLDLPLYEEEYINKRTPVKHICIEGHIYLQSPGNHLNGQGCPKCKKVYKLNTKSFIKKADLIHKNIYDYKKVDYINNKTPVIIICPIHGGFKQRPDSHLRGHGCTFCGNSKSEEIIQEYLINNNIIFVREKIFDECRGTKGLPLRFDFYLPEYNLCIEYDGEHHYKKWRFKDENKAIKKLKNIIKNDELKNKFCNSNKINLLRIPYWEKENIEYLIEEKLKNLKKKGR